MRGRPARGLAAASVPKVATRVALAGALVAVLLLSGCDTVRYYAQSVNGHLSVMAQARPLDDAIADARAANDVRLAQRLALAGEIRAYASRELKLPDNGSYRRYADLHRSFVVWSVFATPELSMTLKTWCFPVVGCISYRGYYDQADAERYAAQLRSEGLEAYVAGIPAYSTLGYFDDPLLNTFVHQPAGELARLIFHELGHQVVYVRNDTAFNESFATAVETAGVARWMAQEATPEQRASYRQFDQRRQQFRALVLAARNRLDALYRSPLSDAEKRRRKAELLAELRRQYAGLKAGWGGYAGYDRWFAGPLVNPQFAAVATYQQWVPAFLALLARCGGDWERFYAEARRIGDLPPPERQAALRALAPPAAEDAGWTDVAVPGGGESRGAAAASAGVAGSAKGEMHGAAAEPR
ncbi:aminopeptidase [Cupriavidus sp. USMAHM13]|uniref:aminopeptidase n=1 Tax=Cupriavidus sp. USMAHM13 TaxID=1389192 RepID=UPI0008A6CE20|nr:aminopeptidase [Cupriavidus sp. USMAHM13]AOZ00875.1 aminopeptidase [Cupriavidus sp. USMAHM13]